MSKDLETVSVLDNYLIVDTTNRRVCEVSNSRYDSMFRGSRFANEMATLLVEYRKRIAELEEQLKTLAEHDKQVRKEVCEQIKAEFDTSGFNKIGASLYPPTEEAMWIGKGFNACKERLFNKLNQIQGDKE